MYTKLVQVGLLHIEMLLTSCVEN